MNLQLASVITRLKAILTAYEFTALEEKQDDAIPECLYYNLGVVRDTFIKFAIGVDGLNSPLVQVEIGFLIKHNPLALASFLSAKKPAEAAQVFKGVLYIDSKILDKEFEAILAQVFTPFYRK